MGETRIGIEVEFIYPAFSDGHRKNGPHLEEAPVEDLKKIAHDMMPYLGEMATIPEMGKTDAPQCDGWRIMPEPDLDLDQYKGVGGGAEIVTPPLPVGEAMDALQAIAAYLRDSGATLDRKCGVHVNISMPGIETLNPLTLLMATPDREWTSRYGRRGSNSLRPASDALITYLGMYPDLLRGSDEEMVRDLLANIPAGKKYATNVQKLLEGYGYLEFRHPGGASWIRNVEGVIELATDMRAVLEEAIFTGDPTPHAIDALREAAWDMFDEMDSMDISSEPIGRDDHEIFAGYRSIGVARNRARDYGETVYRLDLDVDGQEISDFCDDLDAIPMHTALLCRELNGLTPHLSPKQSLMNMQVK